MKFTTVFAVIATLVTAVSATLTGSSDIFNTNAKRLANGLAPLPPHRRGGKHPGTPTHGGKKTRPSATISNSCNGGTIHCCDSVTKANPEVQSKVAELLGVVVGPDVGVGLTCSPLKTLGVGSGECSQQTACCEGNTMKGLVVIGCSPISLV
jgi:hypothetical protein